MRLQGKVAIVTGGARGMGRSHCLELAREGADIVTCDWSKDLAQLNYPQGSKAELDKTVADVKALGRRSIGMVVDVSNEKLVKEMVDTTVKEFGKVDILVNNAGISLRKPTHEITEQEWDTMFAVNVKGSFFCCKHVIPHMMKQNSGRIVNISSIAGLRGYATQTHYTASKHAVIGMTLSLAGELAPYKITVNAICPGVIKTPMLEAMAKCDGMSLDDFCEKVVPVPLGALEPIKISQAVIFFASDESNQITGQALVVDGGTLLT